MMVVRRAVVVDAPEILALQKSAYQSEAEIYNDYNIQPLRQSLEETVKEICSQHVLILCLNNVIIGSVRAYYKDGTCYIGKLIVAPEFQGRGFGHLLMREIEAAFQYAERFELFTGCRSQRNLYIYQKLGYQIFDERPVSGEFSMIYLRKKTSI